MIVFPRKFKVSACRPGDLRLLTIRLEQVNGWLPTSHQVDTSSMSELLVSPLSLIVDNLLVGIYSIESGNALFDPWAFTSGYINFDDLLSCRVSDITTIQNARAIPGINIPGMKLCRIEASDIDPLASEPQRTEVISQGKILVLGPRSRNLAIVHALAERGYDVTVSEAPPNEALSTTERGESPDFVISSGYAYKIPQLLTDSFFGRIVNLHASFLPWGKGIGTILYDAILGHPTGFSVHKIDSHIDTGDILFRRQFFAEPGDTTRTYHRRVIDALNKFVLENLNAILTVNAVGTPQAKLTATTIPYTSRLNFELLMRELPNGYDTPMNTLLELGAVLEHNRKTMARWQLV